MAGARYIGAMNQFRHRGVTRISRLPPLAATRCARACKLGKLGEEKLRKLLKNGRADALSTLTEHLVSLSAGGGPIGRPAPTQHAVTAEW